jgi:hypothetical protein
MVPGSSGNRIQWICHTPRMPYRMTTREEILNMIAQLTDDRLSALLPLILSLRDSQPEAFSSATSQSYQAWISPENDIYDELFADELAAR